MNLQFGILIQKKDLYSLHCRKIKQMEIYCLQFAYIKVHISYQHYDTNTALREQIYYKPIIIIALFTMDGQYHLSIIDKLLKHQNRIESYFLIGKVLAHQSGTWKSNLILYKEQSDQGLFVNLSFAN